MSWFYYISAPVLHTKAILLLSKNAFQVSIEHAAKLKETLLNGGGGLGAGTAKREAAE